MFRAPTCRDKRNLVAMSFSGMIAQLRMGVDLAPETDIEHVWYAQDPSHFPVYVMEVSESPEAEWVVAHHVSLQDLPDEVEKMHWDYKGGVRLLEDGMPVFTCWNA